MRHGGFSSIQESLLLLSQDWCCGTCHLHLPAHPSAPLRMDVPPPAAPPPPAHAPPAAAEGSTSGTPHAQLQGAAAASSSTPKLPCNVGSSRRTKTKILTKDGRKVAADLEANVRARWLVEQLVLACAEPRSRRCEDNRLELWLLRNPATGKLLAPGVNVAQAGEQRRQQRQVHCYVTAVNVDEQCGTTVHVEVDHQVPHRQEIIMSTFKARPSSHRLAYKAQSFQRQLLVHAHQLSHRALACR